jgi:pimeloyl-ACP methyl ester carboxylesterase
MPTARQISAPDGRVLVVHDHVPNHPSGDVIMWHHGSPHSGALIEPLIAAAERRGVRLVTYARPSYGGSTPLPGRDIASCAADVAAIADALDLDRFGVVGSSGGGPHALACAALLPERVGAAVTFGGPAPFRDDVDWFAGMHSGAALRAARQGTAARAALRDEFDPEVFVDSDWTALSGAWSALGQDAGRAGETWPDGLVSDDVALVEPWGFALGSIVVPVLIVQGGRDRMIPAAHAHWLLEQIPTAELWLRPRDGHVSVLTGFGVALDWTGSPENWSPTTTTRR